MVLAGKHNSLLTTLKRILRGGEYYVQNVLLDAADFGVPQRRKRAFFLISKNQIAKQDILNKLEKHKCPPQSVLAAFRGLPKPAVRPDDYNDSSDCKSIPNHFSMRHSKQVIDKINRLAPGTGPMSYRRLHPARPSNTLFSGHRAPPAHFSEPRSITVREAARLQGFPDSFRIYGSFGNQMTQVTNAVPPPLAQVVLRVLADVTGVPVT
jgi:DNA (cytosine-5)-methyltransferase 1